MHHTNCSRCWRRTADYAAAGRSGTDTDTDTDAMLQEYDLMLHLSDLLLHIPLLLADLFYLHILSFEFVFNQLNPRLILFIRF